MNVPEEDVVELPKGDIGIDVIGFLSMVMRLRRDARRAFRENGGFSRQEVADLRNKFQASDEDGSGDISNQELASLIEDAFPDIARDARMRPHLLQVLQEADADGNGKLDFGDFVRLMQQLMELRNQELATKESQAIKETVFSQTEVVEFRELFLSCHTTPDGRLPLEEVRRMIKTICPLGEKNSRELSDVFRSISGGTADIDFPEYLWLMRKLLDMNFGNLNEINASPGTV
jgi:Ca2+-binding EF-hand superfamily protein